jgi:hypothetical protein
MAMRASSAVFPVAALVGTPPNLYSGSSAGASSGGRRAMARSMAGASLAARSLAKTSSRSMTSGRTVLPNSSSDSIVASWLSGLMRNMHSSTPAAS